MLEMALDEITSLQRILFYLREVVGELRRRKLGGNGEEVKE